MSPYQDIETVLIPREKIQQAVRELGQRITKDYADEKPLVICILKGSVVFFGDLIRHIDLPLSIDFMTYSAYQGGNYSHKEHRACAGSESQHRKPSCDHRRGHC